MIYIPQRPLINKYIGITILSNVPSILVLVLVPFLFSDQSNQLVISGLVFTLYRFGNIIGLFLGPKVAPFRFPEKLLSLFEVGNLLVSLAFILLIHFNFKYTALLTTLFFLKGLLAGLQNNIRFQWIKNLSSQTLHASKIIVYTTSIIQASFGFGGFLILLKGNITTTFCVAVFALDLVTSLISAIIFQKMKADRLQPGTPHKSIAFARTLKSNFNLAAIDILVALTVAGTNILILKFGLHLNSNEAGYSYALMIYAVSFLIGSYIINEFQRIRIKLIHEVAAFATACFGLWLLPTSLAIFSFFGFFLLYPLLMLGLEKSWFERIDSSEAGFFHARRTILLSFIWSIGEVGYAAFEFDLQVRTLFVVLAFFTLIKRRKDLQ
jgi:hypothetical protein